MNKREFIKELEKRLRILDETELKDIINEYKDVIDEKVQHGKSEVEAVKDFGNIDELTKEILKAYKINPKYDANAEEKVDVKQTVENFEEWVKSSAQKMADFSKSVYNDFKKNNLTIELIFEILIKVIILLVLFALLRLPFELIIHLGKRVLDIAFYPLDRVLMFVWDIIVFLLYFICCVLVSIAMFKNYFNNKDNKKDSKKKKVKEEKKVIKEIKEESKKEEIEVKTNSCESISSVLGKVLKVIFQIFIVICFIIPLAFLIFGVVLVLILSIYYLCIGINTLGILLISIGLFILFSYTSDIFNSLAFKPKKIHFYPFLISLIFGAVGLLLTIHTVFNIEYLEKVPDNNFNENITEYEFNINKL